jgi:hypothetical protein
VSVSSNKLLAAHYKLIIISRQYARDIKYDDKGIIYNHLHTVDIILEGKVQEQFAYWYVRADVLFYGNNHLNL